MDALAKLGWDEDLDAAWRDLELDECVPGRVIADYGAMYKIAIADRSEDIQADVQADVSGRLRHLSAPHELPKVGDWVALQIVDDGQSIIHAVLPRRSEISRKHSGEQFSKQILAANVDIAFLVQALDHDFSPERLQRYLFQLSNEGVEPVIVLNKTDKENDLAGKLDELKALNLRIVTTSAINNDGIEQIAAAIEPGKTAVFLGSSGVGKSTITNALLGEVRQKTQSIREADSKGRHTTTHRELFTLPNGGMIIDTPGLRELQLWGAEDDLGAAFDDIESLAAHCRFANCAHATEPGCAVTQAIQDGNLDRQRLEAYRKFQKELQFLNTKVDTSAAYDHKQTNKKSQKYYNQVIRAKNERKH